MTGVLTGRRKSEHKHPWEKPHVKTESEISVMNLQAKKCQRLPAIMRRWEEAREDPPLAPSDRTWSCQHLDF